jgi:predicted nucleotidyltransferase
VIATDIEQLDEVVRIVGDVLGANIVGIYLHGSTATGRTRPTSDLDVLAVVSEPTSEAERRALVTRIPEFSGSPEPKVRWRPVELTVVRQSAVNPWRYPPERELQYGQWDRERYLAGFVPGPEPDPDLAVLITAALRANRPLLGPPATMILAPVPLADLRQAVMAGVPGLVADLESDTRNVLLTLARIWLTVATGDIASKDQAAAWGAVRRCTACGRPRGAVCGRPRGAAARARAVPRRHARRGRMGPQDARRQNRGPGAGRRDRAAALLSGRDPGGDHLRHAND